MADADPMPRAVPLRTMDLVRDRAVEAVLGQSGLNHPKLAAEIRRRLSGTDIAQGALMREPLIEGAAPFIPSGRSFADCAGNPLHPDVIRAISQNSDPNYRFDPAAQPYAHQLEAWEHLTNEERRSVLVTSGTGSGKTECFLMPLLHDLATEAQQAGRLSGVRAIMLYPLNALIASQRERLSAWTAPFGDRIRFGLYNGLTQEKIRVRDQMRPEEAEDRTTLRSDPPPILVTNITMLEYMTVRRIDRPLIEHSRGKLRWIILDEAHGYVGSAAAEVALLLRRVLLAFDVKPQDVRFVATSATIGEGKDVTEQLRRFLRDLSGADEARVKVVLGARDQVALPTAAATSPVLSAQMLGDRAALSACPPVRAFVRAAEARPLQLEEAEAMLRPTGQPADAVIGAIAAEDGAGPLLPLRVHGFLRAVPGLWGCINPACGGKVEGWPFGAVLPERLDACPDCGGGVLALAGCRECGEPYLEGEERSGRLRLRSDAAPTDEFAELFERDAEGEYGAEDAPTAADDYDAIPIAIASRSLDHSGTAHVKPMTGERCDSAQADTLPYFVHQVDRCGACGAQSGAAGPMLRPLRFGAPFLIGNAAPVLLDGVKSRIPPGAAIRPPADGRQLLSFTDSRQGTARFAANLQAAAERGFVRGHIYHAVQGSMAAAGEDDPALAELRAKIAKMEGLGLPELAEIIAGEKVTLAAKSAPSMDGLSWKKLRSGLAARDEVRKWMRDIWAPRDNRYEDAETLAQFLMLRELARRPRRANTVETMGLARLRFAAIERVRGVPEPLKARGFDVGAWQGLLYAMVDMVARANLAIRASDDDLHWITARGWRKALLPYGEKPQVRMEHAWPIAGAGGNAGNIVRLLEKALRLDRSEAQDRRDLNEVLEAAWNALLPLFSSPAGDGYSLDLEAACVAPVVEAWRCPVTRRVLTAQPLGMSPYGHREGLLTSGLAPRPILMPRLPLTFPRGAQTEQLASWLDRDEAVAALRAEGLWANLHDRVAMLSPYMRAAEHSAQQPPSRLRTFEAAFKAGEINILNCSTTMEMGVDIGSVSAVMMTNVPPALANYRQRVGRAGRRGQGFATSLTYTRDTPLDREMFRDPQAYLSRPTRAPQVKLDSRRIVQRHVNALLLARWFAGEGGEALKTLVGDFFGCPAEVGAAQPAAAPVDSFLDWVTRPSTVQAHSGELAVLARGTVLAGDQLIFEATKDAVAQARKAIIEEWAVMQAQAQGLTAEGRKAIGYQLERLAKDNLLGELAARAVLPGHGFPTAVVPFVHSDKPAPDEAQENDGRGRRRSFPTRNLDIAIRDYAPGAEVVVDGLVYRSAGVTLNWRRPVDEGQSREVQALRTFWFCPCGAADVAAVVPDHCPACHAEIQARARLRYLEPAGFTADRAEKPHAETEIVAYVEPEPERIVARGAGWTPMADPAQGRMRASHDGLVFFSSRGGGPGYDICLECGRAEVATGTAGPSMPGHRPLRHTKANAAGLCPGNDQPFKIVHELALGHDIVTDVAEVQPMGLEAAGAAWAALSALRRALARGLGIEAGEIGMAVRPAKVSIGQKTHSLYLFDRASGGAGFAPQAVALYDQLLKEAAEILDCREPGCERGCSACILTGDLFRQQEVIDRKAALAWARDAITALKTVAQADRFADGTMLSRAVADELATALDEAGGAISLWIGGDADGAMLAHGPLAMVARRARDRGGAVSLIVDPGWLDALDAAAKLALRDFAKGLGIELRRGAAMEFDNGAVAIAAMEGAQTILWASRDGAAALPGEGWGQGVAAPVVRAVVERLPLAAAVPLDSLLPVSGTHFLELAGAVDGTIAGFGGRMAALLLPAIRAAGGTGMLQRIDYNDRYLQSPLVIRLMAETIQGLRDALAKRGADIDLRIITNRHKPNARQPYLVDHDWEWEDDRADVLHGTLDGLGLEADLIEQGAGHGRVMKLGFTDGAQVRIVLDQGFGSWRTRVPAKFDFGIDVASQTDRLLHYSAMIEARGGGYAVVTV
ncbi:DEAD/DEAH box helicase [Sphingobium aromaticivastans]|uniref:DEAD/DEAH box helicase n=1 Tax=Sphingobium aromaticivastans TaxID=1778665 RepID=UPI003019F94B